MLLAKARLYRPAVYKFLGAVSTIAATFFGLSFFTLGIIVAEHGVHNRFVATRYGRLKKWSNVVESVEKLALVRANIAGNFQKFSKPSRLDSPLRRVIRQV